MRVQHGASFETPGGMWRKERIDADVSEFPEAAALDPEAQVLYVAGRLEQRLLRLRWMFGNLTAEQYQVTYAGLEALLVSWVTPSE